MKSWTAILITFSFSFKAFANGDLELAKKLNDPLSYIHAILTENDKLTFSDSSQSDRYAYRLQPVWAINFEESNFSLIPRAVIPYQVITSSGDQSEVSGLGDSIFQVFYAPKVGGAWKWGVGPQISTASRSEPELAGPGNGIGLSGVLVGEISQNLSLALIAGNLWAYDGNFNQLALQPYLTYLINSVPGLYVGYFQSITVNWKAEGDDNVNFPLGATLGKSWSLSQGYGFDLNVGAYRYVTKTEEAPETVLKLGIGVIFP